MKKIIITLTFIFTLYNVSFAQTSKSEPETNCYLKWSQKFEERGAEEVVDGVYPDVIITFRNGSEAECYNGKCEVKEGKIIGMYLKMEDGSYEKVKKKIRYDFPVTVTNGMSKTVLTFEDELINVLFVKLIKAKKAGFMKAAEPSDD
ncbi:MAG: hypothetical protein ABI315_14075 [Bacteroidia bacterium]